MSDFKLYPFQEEGVATIQAKDGRCLVGDQMGLGKTIQILTYIARNPSVRPVIVVCPASVKGTWEHEAKLHLGMRVDVLYGTKAGFDRVKGCKIVVVNYDILYAWVKHLKKLKPELVVCDESHYLMSPGTRRTKAVKALIDGVKKFIPVSGTAITSRPIQLFPVLQMLWPKKFRSRHKFGTEFCRARFRFGQWDYRGASNLKRLHRRLTRLGMVRRLKKDVLKDLPERRRMVVPISLPPEAMKEYNAASGDTAKWLRANYGKRSADAASRAEALVMVGHLKRLAAKLKLDMMVEWVENFLEETDEKIILFCVHKAVVRKLQEKFKGQCAVVTGEVTGTRRQQQFNTFNTDPKCRVFIGNIQAAGVGWSAKKCSTTAFLEMSWNPGDHSQAADRTHGIGRGQEGVQSDTYWLIATGTIEEALCKGLEVKQKNVDAVLDGRMVEDLDLHDSLMKEIMKGVAS